jgi:mono/diheme cytochrome c family protein
MKSSVIVVLTVSALAVAATLASAQPATQAFDRGKFEYEAHCAVCHGLSGKGDGPLAQKIKSAAGMPDLTVLSKKNNGEFPFARVFEVIDGTQSVTWHGTRQMPVWGPGYNSEARESFNDDFRSDPEVFVRARILALDEYVYRLQVK